MWGSAVMKVIIISVMIMRGAAKDWEITCDVNGVINAEVGTGVPISCSYTHPAGFQPRFVIWYKCDEDKLKCSPSEMIFHSGDENAGQDEFKGRVSILEPDATQKNASIAIRDLRVSDTGSYQLKVVGFWDGDGYWYYFKDRKRIKVTGLAQPKITGKTTVEEGDTVNLPCEAQSSPPSTVTWTEFGSHIPLVTGTQRANLVIPNATRDHSGRYSCTAQHLTKTLTSIADVTVMNKCAAKDWVLTYDVNGPINTEFGTSGIISCSFTHPAGFQPRSVIWYKCDEDKIKCSPSEMIFHSGDENAGQDEFKGRVSILQPDVTQKNASIVIRDLRVSDTGSYQLKLEGVWDGQGYWYYFQDGKRIKVTGLAQPKITGKTTVEEGDTVNLPCEAQSSPPSTVTWAEFGSHIPLVTGTQRANLVIPNATRDHSGRYSCTAQHLIKTLTSIADVTVMNKCPIPDEEEDKGLFSVPILSYIVLTMGIVVVLALMATCIYCLAKTFRREDLQKPGSGREGGADELTVEMETLETGGGQGVRGVDGPEGRPEPSTPI